MASIELEGRAIEIFQPEEEREKKIKQTNKITECEEHVEQYEKVISVPRGAEKENFKKSLLKTF